MRLPQIIGLVSLILLPIFALTTPANSAASTYAQVIPVEEIVTHYGNVVGSTSALGDLDQTGSDNEPGKFILFSATNVPYYGYAVFSLSGQVQADKIAAALLQVNFNGPPHSVQTWTWYIHDWTTDMWHKLGDSIGTQSGQWNMLIFRISSPARYVSPGGEIQIRLTSDRKNNSAKVDYEALHITYIPVTPTATRPAPTLAVTKAGYVFPITFTPLPTNTPTNTPTPTNTATITPTPACAAHDNAFECQVLRLINQERTSRSLPMLVSNILLHTAARGHSTDMAQHNFVSHTGSNGSSPEDRITAAAYDFSTWAENVAAGYATPAEVVTGWMNSSGHRANILNPNLVEIGIGYAYNSASTYGHYWTTDFGKPK